MPVESGLRMSVSHETRAKVAGEAVRLIFTGLLIIAQVSLAMSLPHISGGRTVPITRNRVIEARNCVLALNSFTICEVATIPAVRFLKGDFYVQTE